MFVDKLRASTNEFIEKHKEEYAKKQSDEREKIKAQFEFLLDGTKILLLNEANRGHFSTTVINRVEFPGLSVKDVYGLPPEHVYGKMSEVHQMLYRWLNDEGCDPELTFNKETNREAYSYSTDYWYSISARWACESQ